MRNKIGATNANFCLMSVAYASRPPTNSTQSAAEPRIFDGRARRLDGGVRPCRSSAGGVGHNRVTAPVRGRREFGVDLDSLAILAGDAVPAGAHQGLLGMVGQRGIGL